MTGNPSRQAENATGPGPGPENVGRWLIGFAFLWRVARSRSIHKVYTGWGRANPAAAPKPASEPAWSAAMIAEPANRIFVPLDTPDLHPALDIARTLHGHVGGVKIGVEIADAA